MHIQIHLIHFLILKQGSIVIERIGIADAVEESMHIL